MLKAFEGTQVEHLGIVNLCGRYKNRESYEDFCHCQGCNSGPFGWSSLIKFKADLKNE